MARLDKVFSSVSKWLKAIAIPDSLSTVSLGAQIESDALFEPHAQTVLYNTASCQLGFLISAKTGISQWSAISTLETGLGITSSLTCMRFVYDNGWKPPFGENQLRPYSRVSHKAFPQNGSS
jgi:hypothetical protein